MAQAPAQDPTFTRILVPTDFSPCSQDAVRYAVVMAKRFGASISALHVIETMSYAMTESLQWVDLYAHVRTLVEPMMDGLVRELKEKGLTAVGSVIQGVAYDEIVKKAKEGSADLIVMGTHGRRGMRHLLMGSVAERVVRASPCPVLTVRGD
jgi:nucleotide-binding universal stress UspA family protein